MQHVCLCVCSVFPSTSQEIQLFAGPFKMFLLLFSNIRVKPTILCYKKINFCLLGQGLEKFSPTCQCYWDGPVFFNVGSLTDSIVAILNLPQNFDYLRPKKQFSLNDSCLYIMRLMGLIGASKRWRSFWDFWECFYFEKAIIESWGTKKFFLLLNVMPGFLGWHFLLGLWDMIRVNASILKHLIKWQFCSQSSIFLKYGNKN